MTAIPCTNGHQHHVLLKYLRLIPSMSYASVAAEFKNQEKRNQCDGNDHVNHNESLQGNSQQVMRTYSSDQHSGPRPETHCSSNPKEEKSKGRSPSFRRPEHRPNTPISQSDSSKGENEEVEVYVLSLLTDDQHQRCLTTLRRRYFPPHLYKVGAHITLFHALLNSHVSEITTTLSDIISQHNSFSIVTEEPFMFYGKENPTGVCIGVDSVTQGKIQNLRELLREKWMKFLSDQDRQKKIRAHYTIMNKVRNVDEILKCHERLKEDWRQMEEGRKGMAEGMTLWKYDRGWWVDGKEFRFRDSPASVEGWKGES